jgi:hypothetical protein
MHPFFQRPGVRRARLLFRWCRITVWVFLLIIIGAIAYLHMVGLPDFVKRPLLRRLMAEGLAAEFSNMQLGWWRGPSVIIENAAFSRSHDPLSPKISTTRAEMAVDWRSLLHNQVVPRSLQILNARLEVPVSITNGDSLVINKTVLDVHFSSNDVARIDNCRGTFHGVQVDVIGIVRHVSLLHRWKLPSGGGTNNVPFQERLRGVVDALDKIHFAGTPVLQIQVGADGQDMNSFHAEMNFAATSAETPWGNYTNLNVAAACARLVNPGDQPFVQIKSTVMSAVTPWLSGDAISCAVNFSSGANSNIESDIRFDAGQFSAPLDADKSHSFTADRFSWSGAVRLAGSNFALLGVTGQLHAVGAKTPWGSARALLVDGHAGRARDVPPDLTGWGRWSSFAPWTADWFTDVRELNTPKLKIEHADFSAHWHAPRIELENVHGDLYGGHGTAAASLDVATRELHCAGATDFNPHAVTNLFRVQVRDWLAELDWSASPKINLAGLRVVLPPWTNRPPGWSAAVDSSLQFDGKFSVGYGSFREVPAQSATGHVTYTNHFWNISDVHATRPDGVIDLHYDNDERTGGYHFVIDSSLDPRDALPLMDPRHKHLLDDFSFPQTPRIHAETWGRWNAPARLAYIGDVRASNFVYRGERVATLNAAVNYTNFVLSVRNFALSSTDCQAQAPWAQYNYRTQAMRVTNLTGTMDPALLRRLLPKNPPDFLNHLHFDTLPRIAVSGAFSLTNSQDVDLHFYLTCDRVEYTNLTADAAVAQVDWVGQTIAVTNISANVYDGSLAGWITFDTAPNRDADFHADFTTRNIDLTSLTTGLTGRTNHVEGRLDGHLALQGPNRLERADWQGYGYVHVHDGLLWDIKLFGLLSPVLNAISPGWGHSRAREATADFIITNGVVSSDNVNVRCTGFILKLRGTVDPNRRINARFEAELSRKMPLFGPIVSAMFTPLGKMFEYRITGPLRDPTMEPIYVPKFIMLMLHPFHTIKSIAEPNSNSAPPPDNSK